jgi:hypothetical protein
MTKPVTPNEMFDLWQKMVNPGAYPLQSLMFPVLDPKELERKIGELQVVEHWLKANVSMVQLTVKSLQFQLSMLKGGEKAAEAFKPQPGGDAGEAADAANPASWAWNIMAQAGKDVADAHAKAMEAPAPARKPRKPRKKK